MESQAPKLLDRVRDAMCTRHCSRRTEEAYVYWVRRYILFHCKTHPSQMGVTEISRLPAAAREVLTAHLARGRQMHEVDVARGLGRVVLPFAVARKYRNAAAEWRWQFVFPAARICRDPRWGAPSRYRLHESVIQKAVTGAARQAGLTKRVGPHTMRHSCAE